ncbi:MAG TPA: alanine racemase [Terriglobales bacterium]|nr:alanine racemase [Terriglobales bacterium]
MATIEIAKRAATRPTWAEVSLRTLRENYRTIRDYVGPGVTVCAVVKAYAYGHGAVECAKALQDEGATWLGVTSLDEAIPLREEGIDTRILLMTGFWRGEEEEVVRLGLTPTLWEVAHVELMEKAAIRVGVQQHHVHLKIDTGMGRLGATVEELAQVLQALRSASHLKLEGVATHLASSEVLDAPSVAEQLKNFEAARRLLREFGFNPTHVHAANTSAVISHHESWNTMVRPGLALYGYHLPFERAGRVVSGRGLKMPLKPVLTWKTRIFSLREMKAGQALGYGGTYVTKAPSRIAVLPVGYADGLNRGLSAGGRVIVRESYAPIVGRISMDLTLVDVTGISDIEVGDEVVLLGSSDGLNVDAREHAELANTIPYEILCAISKRVPRRYSS